MSTMLRQLGYEKKFKYMAKYFKRDMCFRILDVGCGNHSPSRTKIIFPFCEYYGLDKIEVYNNSKEDMAAMDGFFLSNLEKLSFSDIKDGYFDIIVMSHVIEHLKNGDQVISSLIPKLKQGGLLYLEYPSLKSTKLPSMRGTLNFFDDETHVRVFSLIELYNLLLRNSCKIISGGYRRDIVRILTIPIRMFLSIKRNGFVQASVFWELTAFAEYVLCQRKQPIN